MWLIESILSEPHKLGLKEKFERFCQAELISLGVNLNNGREEPWINDPISHHSMKILIPVIGFNTGSLK